VAIVPRDARRDPVALGLIAVAIANAASAAAAGTGLAAAAATCALPVVYLLGRRADSRFAAKVVVAVGAASAAAGLASLLLQRTPMAERIGGIWRAGGTFEYPPALALVCVCALACVGGLVATGSIDRPAALVTGCVLAAGVALSYDRAGIVAAVVVAAAFLWRMRAGRRVYAVIGIATVAALVALALARPPLHALEVHLRHGTISSRTDAWSDAVRAFRRRSGLGYGPGRFAASYAAFPSDATRVGRAHDAVLDQAVEAGFVAAVGMALVLAVGAGWALRAVREPDPMALAWGLVALCAVASAVYDFTWSYPPIAAIGLVGIGRARQCLPAARAGR
jgi:O-antigen ligase